MLLYIKIEVFLWLDIIMVILYDLNGLISLVSLQMITNKSLLPYNLIKNTTTFYKKTTVERSNILDIIYPNFAEM